MSTHHGDPGHGDSPAAWTAVVIMLLAIAAGTVFFFLDMPVAVWACVVVMFLGWIIGGIMSKMGFGVNGPKFTPKAHD